MTLIYTYLFIFFSFESHAGLLDCCNKNPMDKLPPKRTTSNLRVRSAAAQSIYPSNPILINKLIAELCTPDVTICRLRNKKISAWELSHAIFPPHILVLDLSNNEITDIWPSTRFPPLLRELVLKGNQIYRIRPDILPTSLEILALSHNDIESFDDLSGLKDLQSLYILNLNRNYMQSVCGDLREILPNTLTYLMLSGNSISTFEASIPPSVTLLDLKNNRLHSVSVVNQAECDDSLQILYDPLRDSPTDQSSQRAQQSLARRSDSAKTKNLEVQSIMEMLPRLIWDSTMIERKCEICCEEFQNGEVITTLPCLHQYHCKCVMPWLKQKENCPGCRHDINVIDFTHFEN